VKRILIIALLAWSFALSAAEAQNKTSAPPIFSAIKKGDTATVAALLKQNPKLVAAKDKNGETPLHEAARRGHKDIAELLLANKANVNARNGKSYQDKTPLVYAVIGNHRALAELLLKNKANPDAQDLTWRASGLHEAVQRDKPEMVKLLLAYEANPNLLRRYGGSCTPIHHAKNHGMMTLLLKSGAGINSKDADGYTLLRNAVRYKKPKTIRFLLANKADPTVGDGGGRTPFHVAACSNDRDIAVLTPFLDAKANVNVKTSSGVTPLHEAARAGGKKAVEALLAHGADVKAVTSNGETVLHRAVAGTKRLEIVKLLLEKGCDPNAKDLRGRTPLFNATRVGDMAVIGLLFKRGLDPSPKDSNANTTLHLAARWGKTDVVKALLARKANPNAKDKLGRTPLHLAARRGFKDTVQALLSAGADPNTRDQNGETPLFWPTALGHRNTAKMLRAKGAKIAPAAAEVRAPAPAKDAADFIVSRMKMRKGLALDLGCGDGKLAAKVAKKTKLFFYCISPDKRTVGKARTTIDATGLYGTRVTVYSGALDTLALPSHCANLVICGDEFVAGKGKRDFKELFRVLSPNGVAVIGQSAAAASKGHKLTRAELEGWLREAGISTFEIVEQAGLWACIAKPRPAGADEWRFRDHDPGNTRGSLDTLVGSPMKSQWVSGWLPGISAASIVIGDGRMICASLDYQGRSSRPTGTPFLQAVDAYTGIQLWARQGKGSLPFDRGTSTYGAIAIDIALIKDSLYLLGGKSCYQFDAATGKSRNVFPIPAEAGPGTKDIWLYLSGQDDLLLGSMGPRSGVRASWAIKFSRGNSKAVFALDRKTGEKRWSHAGPLMTGSLAIGDGKVFFCTPDYRLHALDVQTGKELWTASHKGFGKTTDIVRGMFYQGKYWLLYHPTSGRWVTKKRKIAGDGVRNARKLAAFSAEDGKYLFDAALTNKIAGVSFAGGTIYGASQHQSKGMMCAVDAATGKLKWKKMDYFKCGPLVTAEHAVFARSGIARLMDVREWEKTKSQKALRWQDFSGFRATCTYPAIPANGMAYIQGPGCNCAYPIRASAAMIPGKIAQRDSDNRLLKGPGYADNIAEPADETPWQTWRSDARRSGITTESPANVPDFAKLWSHQFRSKPAPPAAAGGLVFTPSGSRLSAIDAKSGKPAWQHFAEGTVRDAPWCWKGRVYLTDNDGWVYCLRADSGKLVWRFRAAWARERMIAYGRLTSRWPVRGGVLIHDGILYCSAGFFPAEGVTTYALDAKTGELKWEKTHVGHGQFTPSGPMAMGKGRIYAPNGWGYPSVIRLDDKNHVARQLGRGAHGLYAKAISVIGDDDQPLRLPHMLEYVHWRGNLKRKAGLAVLPVVDGDTVYLRGTFLTAEKWAAFKVSAGRLSTRHSSAPLWTAWRGVPMTAIIKAGDTIFTGSAGRVHATSAADGQELWSAPVPAKVTDLAFNNGKLLVTCANNALICFSAR
jgi:ankyrin repeat protein/outer membrane protein assembly factor BamB